MRPRIFAGIFLFLIFSYQPVHAADREPKNDETAYDTYDPSQFFHHLEYELDFYIDRDLYRSRYHGSLFITLRPKQITNKFFLDQKLITIDGNSIKAWKYTQGTSGEVMVAPVPVKYGRNVRQYDGYKIKLEEYMYTNSLYKIRLEFSNRFTYLINGLIIADYRINSYHLDEKGMVYSRMKETNAHHIFPCFNHIAMKATFKIRIGHFKNLPQSFTNTKFISQENIDNPEQWLKDLTKSDMTRLQSTFVEAKNAENPDKLPKLWVMDDFARTYFISTFSVALAVLSYKSLESEFETEGPPNTDHSKVEVKVWAEGDILYLTKEIRRIAELSLVYYEKFFETSYDLGKLDFIVLPDDSITEDDYYGLVYLGEKTLKNVLTETTNYCPEIYLLVANICRAIGRQWIGHLVTFSMLNETWFYDGLHTYLQRNCVINVYQHWKADINLDLIDSFITLLRTEERGHLYNPILDFSTFSEISTKKLNSETKLKIHFIIRMVSFIMELEGTSFQRSLVNYIKEFKNSSPSLTQVWGSLTKTVIQVNGLKIPAANTSLDYIITSWLSRRGHPLISAVRSRANKMMILTQKPFTFPNQEASEGCWSIPFHLITKDNNIWKRRIWLTCQKSELDIPLNHKEINEWVVISFEFHVPARVDYDKRSWSLIKELFHNEEELKILDSMSRIQIIHDMFTLAEASQLDFDFVFEIMKYISHETDYKCWHVIYKELSRVRSRWVGTKLFDPFQEFIRTIVKPIFDLKIYSIDVFLNSPRSKPEMEKMIILIACTFEFPNCEKYGKTFLASSMESADDEIIDGMSESLRESFLCSAMKTADEKAWDSLLDEYKEFPSDMSILRALGCTKNKILLKKLLDWSMDANNDIISPSVSLKIFEILSSSYEGYQLVTPFFRKRHLGKSNKDTNFLKEFISRFKTDIIIDDFFMKALENTKKKEDLETLLKFSTTLKDRKQEKVQLEKEIVSIVNRHLSWFNEKAEDVYKYLIDSLKVKS